MRVFDDAGAVPTVPIAMCFTRHGGWKVIPAPDGAGGLAAELARPDGTALRAPRRAWRWRQQLAAGRYGLIQAARAERVHHARVTSDCG